MSNASPTDDAHAAGVAEDLERAPQPVRAARPGGAIAVLATVVGAAWIAAAALAAFVMIGPSGAAQVSAPVWALIGAGTILPALMVWFAGAAAQEGARARHEAARLADAAERLLSPASSAEAGARKLAASVRIEISALDRALEHTIVKLREAQTLVQTQETAVGKIAAQAQTSASKMVSGLERERAELLQIAQDLNTHAEMISGSISKHAKVIAEAAELAESEVKAADAVLDQKLSSFDAAAALIGDRTQALNAAAQASAESTLRLEQALSGALETLAKAGQLTDAARHSAEAASNAARATAGALQDTTARAIEDARRAAEIIRGEAASVERDAAAALDRLRHAADGARHAAQDVRDAASGRDAHRSREPQRPADPAGYGWSAAAPRGRPAAAPEPPQDNDWSWRELLSNMDEEPPPPEPPPQRLPQRPGSAPRRAPAAQGASDPVARLAQAVAEPRGGPQLPAVRVIESAGVALADVFSAAALDRIAQRARNGTQARRKAVKDAAPDAVRKLAEHLRSDRAARTEAAGFLRQDGARIAELLGRGRGAMGADATRAFLLLDAADG